MNDVIWLLIWYGFCALIIWGFIAAFRFINTSKFRSSDGDATTEVGYSEDSTGNEIGHSADGTGSLNEPHVQVSGNSRSGPM